MERVTGVGGVFFRSKDPKALVAWYSEHLGVPVMDDGFVVFPESRNTVWAPFAEDTEYWPAAKQGMVNFTVHDLDAMLAQLRAAGIEVDEKIELLDGIGRFGWAVDPEGNRFELWEPDAALPSGG
jgi:glyoxylase I family protein